MNISRRSLGPIPLLAAAAGAAAHLCSAHVVRADVQAAYMPGNYSYEVTHVPDQDQRRSLLADDGNMHCVPTAAMNWLMYFANHGLPSLPPGAGNWQSVALYNAGSSAIYNLGLLMGTNESNGTSGAGAEMGLDIWLGNHPIVYAHYYSNHDWSPDFEYLASHAFNGGYVMPIVGWYSEPGCMQRNGGHALSLNLLQRSGEAREIAWRDPATNVVDPLGIAGQSQFSTEDYSVTQRWVTPCWASNARWMSRINGYSNGHIDEMFAFYSQFALTSPPLVLSEIHAAFALNLFGSIIDPNMVFHLPSGFLLKDAAIQADLLGFLFTTQPGAGFPAKLWKFDPVTSEPTEIDVGLATPSKLVVGRKRAVYVLNGTQIVCINLDLLKPEITAAINPPHPVDAMTYDDLTDQLVLLSIAAGRIMLYSDTLGGGPTILSIPDAVPLEGQTSLAFDPTGGWWVLSEASNTLYHLQLMGGALMASPLSSPALFDPQAVDVGGNGDVFVSNNGSILQFHQNAAGAWQLLGDSPYTDVPAGAILKIAKSRSNFDPKLHVGPAWDNVLPLQFEESVLDCLADIAPIGPEGGSGGNGVVDVDDLLMIINAWGACADPGNCVADIAPLGGNTSVDIDDLLAAINAWGQCP